MAEKHSLNTYIIPDNFIGESRILNGMLNLRATIEGVILSLIGALIGLAIPVSSTNSRITLLVACCAPFFLLGLHGFNGDYLSVAIKSAIQWKRGAGKILYNPNSKLLVKKPLDAMMEEEQLRDKVIGQIENMRQKRIDKIENETLKEGVDFEFERDTSVSWLEVKEPEPEEENKDEDNAASKNAVENIAGIEEFNIDTAQGDILLDDAIDEILIDDTLVIDGSEDDIDILTSGDADREVELSVFDDNNLTEADIVIGTAEGVEGPSEAAEELVVSVGTPAAENAATGAQEAVNGSENGDEIVVDDFNDTDDLEVNLS